MSTRPVKPPRKAAGLAASAFFALVFSLFAAAGKASAAPQAGAPDSGIAGTWRGTLGSGAAELHILLTFSKLSNGEYSGQLNSVDQGAVIPMESISVKDSKVRFEVKAVGGVYEGTLNDA